MHVFARFCMFFIVETNRAVRFYGRFCGFSMNIEMIRMLCNCTIKQADDVSLGLCQSAICRFRAGEGAYTKLKRRGSVQKLIVDEGMMKLQQKFFL